MVHLTRHRNTSVQAEGVRTIGRRRFEIRQRVSCPQSDKRLRYTVETWFFFPHSLQMNRWSYTPTDYQQSLKNYIRLGVPVHVLESLLGPDDPRFAHPTDMPREIVAFCEETGQALPVETADFAFRDTAFDIQAAQFVFGFHAYLFAAEVRDGEIHRRGHVVKIKIVSEDNEASLFSNPTLMACNVGVGISSSGLAITFDTTASHSANEIGVKDVVLQEKTWYGGWKDIPMSNYCTYNSDWYAGDVVYTGANKGTTYRVKCTHYAKFGSTELTLDNTSSELTYN